MVINGETNVIEIKYFARLSESLGMRSEQLEFDDQISSAADIVERLISRGGKWAEEFSDDNRILVAINQQMCESSSVVNDGDEVAFFPPVTGG